MLLLNSKAPKQHWKKGNGRWGPCPHFCLVGPTQNLQPLFSASVAVKGLSLALCLFHKQKQFSALVTAQGPISTP